MSIENLKKILESERLDTSKQYGLDMFPVQNIQTTEEFTQDVNFARRMTYSGAFKSGHEAATNRLLPLLQKAVEMANFYSSWVNMQDGIVPPGDCEIMFVYEPLDKDKNGVTVGGKKAREFLTNVSEFTEGMLSLSETTESVSEFTKMTEIVNPGHYIIDAKSFDKLVEDLDKEPSEQVKKAREKFSQLKKEGE